MLRGLCLLQIPFSLMVSTATSSKQPSIIPSRENYLSIHLQSQHTICSWHLWQQNLQVCLPPHPVPLLLLQHLLHARQRVGIYQMTAKLGRKIMYFVRTSVPCRLLARWIKDCSLIILSGKDANGRPWCSAHLL